MRFLRAERKLGWIVVSDGTAQRKGCVVEGQMGAAGIAVHGGCLSAVLARLECTRRGWSGPPLGAAATERWSERGPGLRHGIGPLSASGSDPEGRVKVSGGTCTANADGARAV